MKRAGSVGWLLAISMLFIPFTIWGADEATIQVLQTDVSITKAKTDDHEGKLGGHEVKISDHDTKIRNLEGGLPAEQAARIAADKALQDAISRIQLTPGPQGPAGPTGPAGLTGATGAIGPAGPAGTTGPAGPAGTAGATGPQGPIGLTGPAGPAGPEGSPGIAGAPGAIGPPGPQGLKGDTGATGPVGPVGATGPQGLKGDAGATGAQGPQGPIGLTGPAGPVGPTGATGPAYSPTPSDTTANIRSCFEDSMCRATIFQTICLSTPNRMEECKFINRHVFVTSALYKGNFNFADPDLLCQNHAKVAGLAGNYKAWISTVNENDYSGVNPKRIYPSNGSPSWTYGAGKYISANNIVMANNYDDLRLKRNHPNLNPFCYDEFGTYVCGPVDTPNNKVWTATTSYGYPCDFEVGVSDRTWMGDECSTTTNKIDKANRNTCGDWTIGDGTAYGQVGILVSHSWPDEGGKWSNYGGWACNLTARLYCVQQ